MSTELSFAKLNSVNVIRCQDVFPECREWSESDWAIALVGEVGEACNLVKKRNRGQKIDPEIVADEIADAVIYADLLCEKLGVSLEAAIIRKFNEVSKRRNYQIKL